MAIKIVEGDLFERVKNEKGCVLIPHVCNNIGAWGAGFVVPLGVQFPEAKARYLQWVKKDEDSLPFGLGSTQFVTIDNVVVCNMVAQNGTGGIRPLRYNALSRCLDEVAIMALSSGGQIICPAFGSGLAGGYWPFIEALIKDCWLEREISVTVCYLSHQKPEGLVPTIRM